MSVHTQFERLLDAAHARMDARGYPPADPRGRKLRPRVRVRRHRPLNTQLRCADCGYRVEPGQLAKLTEHVIRTHRRPMTRYERTPRAAA